VKFTASIDQECIVLTKFGPLMIFLKQWFVYLLQTELMPTPASLKLTMRRRGWLSLSKSDLNCKSILEFSMM